MKYFILYLIISQTQAQIAGKIRAVKKCNSNGSTYDMCTGCLSILKCFSFGMEVEQSCASKSIETPYCDQEINQCVEYTTCNQKFTMKCKYEGFFPNPVNCQQFLYCDGPGSEPQVYSCPPKTNYDHSKQRCSFIAECITFSFENGLCKNRLNQVIRYPLDAGIYVVCSHEEIELRTCELSNQIFNLTKLDCELITECKFEGIFRYNDTHFYMCYSDGYELKQMYMECNDGTTFEYDSKFCKNKNEPNYYLNNFSVEKQDVSDEVYHQFSSVEFYKEEITEPPLKYSDLYLGDNNQQLRLNDVQNRNEDQIFNEAIYENTYKEGEESLGENIGEEGYEAEMENK